MSDGGGGGGGTIRVWFHEGVEGVAGWRGGRVMFPIWCRACVRPLLLEVQWRSGLTAGTIAAVFIAWLGSRKPGKAVAALLTLRAWVVGSRACPRLDTIR